MREVRSPLGGFNTEMGTFNTEMGAVDMVDMEMGVIAMPDQGSLFGKPVIV
jgi:hypothetical protein